MGWRAQDAWDSENRALLDEIKYRKSTVWKPAILWFFVTAGFIFSSYWNNSGARSDGSIGVDEQYLTTHNTPIGQSAAAIESTRLTAVPLYRYTASGRSNMKRQTSIVPARKPASQ